MQPVVWRISQRQVHFFMEKGYLASCKVENAENGFISSASPRERWEIQKIFGEEHI